MEDHGQEESDLHLGPFYCQSGSKVTNIFWLVMLSFHVIIWIAFPMQNLEWLDPWFEILLQGPPRSRQFEAFQKVASSTPKQAASKCQPSLSLSPSPAPRVGSSQQLASAPYTFKLNALASWSCHTLQLALRYCLDSLLHHIQIARACTQLKFDIRKSPNFPLGFWSLPNFQTNPF